MLGFFHTDKIETIGVIGSQNVIDTFDPIEIPSSLFSINFFGLDIQSPAEWALDELKQTVLDFLLGYIQVLPIVLGVSAAVYILIGLFSKTLAKLGVLGVVLYSMLVYLTI